MSKRAAESSEGMADRRVSPSPAGASSVPIHVKARGPHPAYPVRTSVDDKVVSWDSEFNGYEPVEFVHRAVLANDSSVKKGGWADPQEPTPATIEARSSYELQRTGAPWRYDASKRPLNPRGRTGMTNRGLLGKWGPNHAADPIVTRKNPISDRPIQMVAIRRRDTGDWAIPGGMVEPGEHVSATMRREFTEEAGNLPGDEKPKFEEMLDTLFKKDNGHVVYSGYVDDPRNTDNAWMETVAMHFHCPEMLGAMLKLHAGDDAADVQWLEIDDSNSEYQNLYASHKAMVDDAVAGLLLRERSQSGGGAVEVR